MASPDDSAYSDNPYGTTDPTALFQQLTAQNQNRGNAGIISQGTMSAGFNPAVQQSRQIQDQMSKILQGVGPPQDNEDPLDYQMRQARAVSTGMSATNPSIAIKADQQMLKLQNAQAEQAKLKADTTYLSSESRKNNVLAAQAENDPMVLVQQGKDQFGLPTYNAVGNPISTYDEKGQPRTGWSNDVSDGLKSNPGAQPMRQSQYLSLVEKTNEGKNLAAMQSAQIRAQQGLMQLSLLDSPEQKQAIESQAADIVARRTAMPPQPPLSSRNMAAMQTWSALKNEVDRQQEAATPGTKFDNSDYGNNVKQENAWGHGPDSDTVRRIGVAEAHLQDLEVYSRNLKQYGPDSPITNAVSQRIQKWLGGVGPVQYDTANDRVAGEITSAVIGKTAALADRQAAQDDTAAKLSSAQKSGSYDALHTMLYDQASGLRSQFLGGLQGMTDDEKARRWNMKLNVEGRAMMSRVDAQKGVSGAGNPISGNPATVPPTATAKETPTTGSAADNVMVHMIGPDGKGYTVKQGEVNAAIAAGYKKG